MRLKQGQVWQKKDRFYRIVEWSRLSIKYKLSFLKMVRRTPPEEVSKNSAG